MLNVSTMVRDEDEDKGVKSKSGGKVLHKDTMAAPVGMAYEDDKENVPVATTKKRRVKPYDDDDEVRVESWWTAMRGT
jgi:hypothetical protein